LRLFYPNRSAGISEVVTGYSVSFEVCCHCTVHAATNMGRAEVFYNCNRVSEETRGIIDRMCKINTRY